MYVPGLLTFNVAEEPMTAVPLDQEYVPPPVAVNVMFGVEQVKIVVDGEAIPAVGSGFTTIVRVVLVAHIPADGVKVYVVVCWLFSTGDQVPVIPFKDVVGNGFNVFPGQIAVTGLKVGNTFGLTVRIPLRLLIPSQKPPPFEL